MKKDSQQYKLFWAIVDDNLSKWEVVCSPKRLSINNWGCPSDYKFVVKRPRESFLRLRRMGYFIVGGDHLRITEKAKYYVLVEKMMSAPDLSTAMSSCFISFDIPVTNNSDRSKFRSLLIKIGCTKVHGSLWTTNKDISGPLSQLIKFFNIAENVTIILGKRL